MTQPTATPIADLTAAILPPTHPVLLLPIRIETALDGTTLLIRAYPDEIHIDRRPTTSGGQPTARPRLLPTRFVATGWRDGARVFAVTGLPITEDALRVALDLDSATPAAGMDWLQDFTTAEQAGMAMRVTLDPPRLDRLLVFGVRDDLDAAATQAAFIDVLSGRDDVRFVAVGEATNQVAPSGADPATGGSAGTSSGTSGSPSEAAGSPSGAAGSPLGAATAAGQLAAALGLPSDALAALDGAAGGDDAIAAAMHAALWPGTLGYYFAHRLGGPNGTGLAPADQERARRAFIDHVRADGPLPTLRIGDQPYGFLPTSTLDSWVGGGEPLGAGAVDVLRKARSVWLAAATTLPSAAGGPADLLEALRNSPTTQGIDARTLMGPLYAANLLRYVGMPEWAAWMAQRDQLGTAELRAVGLGWTPPAARSVFAPDAYRLREPFVADTSPAFLTMLAGLDPGAPPVISTARPFIPMASVLDEIARYAVERAYADASGQAAPEGELLGFGLAGQVPLAFTPSATSAAVTEQKAALTVLGTQPIDVLIRQLTGTLDLAAHRIDAWITAVATGRLAAARSTTAQGLRVGAFGWVEGLMPRAEGPASEGWIAAPSTTHATTAAVLRNGFRARRLAGEAPGTLAVDLVSKRVRHALRILDEVRAGRTLSAVLAEQLERGMHDAGLDPMIERIRALAPRAGGGTDGLSVAQQWTDHRDLAGFDFGASRTAMGAVLDEVVESLDAVADLTLAEGVHQVVTGNPVRAGALFDALGRGEQPPPEITVTTTPRRSVHHTIRLMVAVPPDAARTPGDWPDTPASVRAAAEPRADAWAAAFLGPATGAAFTVTWTDGSTTAGTLADLDLAPLDVVALAARPEDLDDWLIHAVAGSAPAGATGSVTARPVATCELAGALRKVLSGARAAVAADLDPNALAVDDAPPDPAAVARAAAAARALDQAIAAADGALSAGTGSGGAGSAETGSGGTGSAGGPNTQALTDALVGLARFGVPQSLPAPGASAEALRDRTTQAVEVARRRAAAATAATGAGSPGAVLAAVFDEPFVLFGPLDTSAFPQRDAPTAAAAIGWLDLAGRVHPGAGALSDALLYDEALGRPPSFAAIQQPNDPSEPTVLDPSAALPDPRRFTLLGLPLGSTLPAQSAAILVDGWVEPVPNAQETAGLAFHLERPASQPPQACLIAVPPDPAAQWTTATLEAVLLETLDAARMRSVPAEALLGAAQFLPALQFANNTAGETVSASFSGLAVE